MIAAADIHRIFRTGLRGPLGDLGYRLLPKTRRPVFFWPDNGRHRLVEFGTDPRAYPDNQYGSVYDCGFLTRRDLFVDDGESLDTEQQLVEFGERVLDPKSERLAAYYPISTERHAEQWVEFHARRLPPILDRYYAKYPVH
jgi:hypothetical protein